MSKTATLTATADPGARGKQFVARITGVNTKREMTRTSIGSSAGQSVTEVEATPGIYQSRSATTSTKVRGGGTITTEDTYYVVWIDGLDARATKIEESDAIDLAAEVSRGPVDWSAVGARRQVARYEMWLERLAPRAGSDVIRLGARIGSLESGHHSVDTIRAAYRSEIARMRGESPDRPLDLDGGPTDKAFARAKLEAERAALIARLAEIDAALAEAP